MSDYLDSYTGSHALVVGINVYPNAPNFNPLGEAERDAMDLAEVLEGEPYSFKVRTLLAEEASRAAILDALFELESTGPDDRVIFYFAGHGYTLSDRRKHETGYLACFDTFPERHHTALRMDEVTDFRWRAKAKHVAFIFDACFSGQALGLARAAAVAAGRFLQKPAYHAISAGAAGETVADYQSMTRLLLGALKQPALVDPDILTIERLGSYLKYSMAAETRSAQTPQFGQLTGSGGGDMVLYLPPEQSLLERLPQRLQRGLSSADADVRYLAIESLERLLGKDDHREDVLAVLQALSTDDPDAEVRKRALKAVVDALSARPPVSRVVEKKEPPLSTRFPVEEMVSREVAIQDGEKLRKIRLNLVQLISNYLATKQQEKISTRPSKSARTAFFEKPRLPFEPELVRIPTGRFWMGSTEEQARQFKIGIKPKQIYDPKTELPLHEVELSEYFIGKYPITNREYRAFVEDCGYQPPTHWNNIQYPVDKGDHPVVYVSWEDAQAFCRWLADKTGKPYRLPTEAEWEKAARGSDGRLYPWGSQFDSERCNTIESGIQDTTSVNRYQGGGDSPYGVLDMAGNVWEWTSTLYKEYEYHEDDGREDSQATGNRVLRGGCFGDNRGEARSTYRNRINSWFKHDDVGFRVAFSAQPLLEKPVSMRTAQDDTEALRLARQKLVQVLSNYLVTRRKAKISTSPSKSVSLPGIVNARLPFEPELVRIPAGAFLMGSTEEQIQQVIKAGLSEYYAARERPKHKVELPEYLIGKYPVTNREYQAFVRDSGYNPPGHWQGQELPKEKGDHPVVNVTWQDAQAYCRWLARKTGRPYRLPTEAEWEKAARGSDGRIYPWGDEFDPQRCNTSESGIRDTTPVGKYQGIGDSPYGAADMAGNVWEWTSTLLKDYPYKAGDGREDPQAGFLRMLRGGAFYGDHWEARCAYRLWFDPWGGGSLNGFRLVVSPFTR